MLGVALRKESVDRNRKINTRGSEKMKVALRKESVDRNRPVLVYLTFSFVALRKESVDRNLLSLLLLLISSLSLSARRAWIEISVCTSSTVESCCRSPQGERG